MLLPIEKRLSYAVTWIIIRSCFNLLFVDKPLYYSIQFRIDVDLLCGFSSVFQIVTVDVNSESLNC